MKQGPGIALAACLAVSACESPVESTAIEQKSRPAAATTPGVPTGGPEVLYASPPDIPQLQNRDGQFRAPFEMVSGTERYVAGEYLYTDFIYDDEAATYPADYARYGNNAADLVEFRISARNNGGLAFRFTLNTLLAADSTIAVVAFDSDNDASTGSSTLPRDPGVPFPGTDQLLTTWGTGAEWSRWDGVNWHTVALEAHTDLEANQITVTVPKAVANPAGQWLATLAIGLFDPDPASSGWLPREAPTAVIGPVTVPAAAAPRRIINLGFRFNETQASPPYGKQDAALTEGTPTRFANVLDFDLLRSGGARDNVPTHGMIYRMFASRMPSVTVVAGGNETLESEGKNRASTMAQYLSPLQPYAVYIPSGYDPNHPVPMTFALHGLDGYYYWINDAGSLIPEHLGNLRNSIVLSPAGRGDDGFYVDDLEYDVFEAWNDVARHYSLDPQRTSIYGLSMGGQGTWRLALLHPHLFARAVPYIPSLCNGIWIPGTTCGNRTLTNRWVENARNVPFFHIADSASELTFYPGQAQQVVGPATGEIQSLDSNGYRYKFWSAAMDHALGVVARNDFIPAIGEYLAQHAIEPEPFHVTFSRMPSNDHPSRGLIHNRAYWLSGIELRDTGTSQSRGTFDENECSNAETPCAPLAKGVIDAVTLGFGRSDPASSQSASAGVAGRVPYVETQRTWGEPLRVPVENRIVIKATNIASVTIDPIAAQVDCNVQLDIESDGPIEIELSGCRR